MAELCVVQGCAVFNDIGPYFSLLATDAGARITSLYRGSDARGLLKAHGKHDQEQLVDATPEERILWGILGIPDPVDETTHCKRNDGIAYPQWAVKAHLPWWCQGADVLAAEADAMIEQAAAHKWVLHRPYSSGSELHHLNFKQRPSPTPHTIARIYSLRHRLPRN